MTIRCILLDDEMLNLAYLRTMCENIPNVEVVKSFNDPLRLLQEAPGLDYDVCITDIEMPQMQGVELVKRLPGKAVVFTTAYREFAAEAFELEALDYIIKPIRIDRLNKAFEKVAAFLQQKAERPFIQLNSSKGKALLYFEQVYFISTTEGDKRDKLVLLESGEELLLKNISFDQLLEVLPWRNFARINKKTIIALRIVHSYTHDQIISSPFADGKPLRFPLNENYRKDFLKKLGHT